MRRTKVINALGVLVTVAYSISACAYETPRAPAKTAARTSVPTTALWRNRGNIKLLNLYYGAGGKEHRPSGHFKFLKEDKGGTSPKFEVVDQQGVRWKAKLGEESKAETAATRLIWAAGYFTDEDYYLPELRIQNMPRLDRGQEYVAAAGLVRGVRLERVVKGQKKVGTWSWFKNPFLDTKELNGLRTMMALVNNWDLKEDNNAIYQRPGEGVRYAISDLGATFGRTGSVLTRSKGNVQDYLEAKFIQKATSSHVDFFLTSRPLIITGIDVPNYMTRTKMQEIAKQIPRAHARWIGHLLRQLSPQQIRDCFRAAGYSRDEVEGFARAVEARIAELNRL